MIFYELQYFYQLQEVSPDKRNCCGQIVMAFKDNAKHPLYEIGDIIIERNGNIITNFESLTNAVANNGEGTVKFLRFNGSSLELHEEDVKKTDVLVGIWRCKVPLEMISYWTNILYNK